MNLKEQIHNNFKEAFKSGEEVKISVLKMVKAAVTNAEIENKTKGGEGLLTDEEILQVITREAKKRKDAVEAYEKGGRAELAEKEKKELIVLEAYLPEQMGEDEIRGLVKNAIEKTGASNIQDLGKVMSALMSQTKGKADGGLVSRIVRDELGG